VADQRVRAARAAMVEICEHEQAVANDVVRPLAFDVRNESDTARIVLVGRIVKALLLGQSGHVRSPFVVRRRGWRARASKSEQSGRGRRAGIRGGMGPSQR